MVSKQILEKCYELGHIHKGRVLYIHIYEIYVYPFVYRFIHSYTAKAVNGNGYNIMLSSIKKWH